MADLARTGALCLGAVAASDPSVVDLPALLGALWMLAPAGMSARWLGAVLLAPMVGVYPSRSQIRGGVVRIAGCEAGFGGRVQTAEHALVFDAGPVASERLDVGRAVVVPFLREFGTGCIAPCSSAAATWVTIAAYRRYVSKLMGNACSTVFSRTFTENAARLNFARRGRPGAGTGSASRCFIRFAIGVAKATTFLACCGCKPPAWAFCCAATSKSAAKSCW